MNPMANARLLDRMNHEIRTAMNSMLGITELLWETSLTAEQREYVRVFRLSADRLLTLSNGMGELSHVEAATTPLEPAIFDLREAVGQTTELMSVLAREKGLSLSLTVDPEIPATLFGDCARLEQILVILLRNAIRRSAEGEIILHVRAESMGENAAIICFTISDTGRAIPPAEADSLFELGSDGTSAEELNRELDFCLARRLVTAMGGQISAKSATEGGAVFSFTAAFSLHEPATAAADEVWPILEASPAQPLRILVAEDSEDNLFLVKAFLKDQSCEVDSARDGQVAVEMARSVPYDLILMDVDMPVLDGYEATRRIRAWENERSLSAVPIVALTACVQAEDVGRSMSAGCTGYLPKPVRKRTLIDAVARHARRTAKLAPQIH